MKLLQIFLTLIKPMKVAEADSGFSEGGQNIARGGSLKQGISGGTVPQKLYNIEFCFKHQNCAYNVRFSAYI